MGQRCGNTLARDTTPLEDVMLDHDTSVRIPLRARDGSVRAYAVVDAVDADWVNQWRWSLDTSGYAKRVVYLGGGAKVARYRTLRLHREILNLSDWDGVDVDHINRDRLDCRRSNLRALTSAQNAQNQSSRLGTSLHRGVSWHARTQKWQAYAYSDGSKQTYVGVFDDELAAAEAARHARLRLLPFTVERSHD